MCLSARVAVIRLINEFHGFDTKVRIRWPEKIPIWCVDSYEFDPNMAEWGTNGAILSGGTLG